MSRAARQWQSVISGQLSGTDQIQTPIFLNAEFAESQRRMVLNQTLRVSASSAFNRLVSVAIRVIRG